MFAHMTGDPGKIRSCRERKVQLKKRKTYGFQNMDIYLMTHDIDWSLPEVLSFYEVWALAFYRE